MFNTVVLIIHVIVCVAMILIILLQSGKGADIGAAFGGGSSQTVFGSSGATTFLSKVTIVAAVVFMMTSFILTYVAGKGVRQVQRSIVTNTSAPAAPIPGPVQGSGTEQSKGSSPAAVPSETKKEVPGAEKARPAAQGSTQSVPPQGKQGTTTPSAPK